MGFLEYLKEVSCFSCYNENRKTNLEKTKKQDKLSSSVDEYSGDSLSVSESDIIISPMSADEIHSMSDIKIENIQKREISVHYIEPLPPINSDMPTLVLDLDNTIVFSSVKELPSYDHKIKIVHNGKKETVWIKERPGLQRFLDKMSEKYEIVVFTAGIQQYGIKVIKRIDPKRKIRFMLDRRFCRSVGLSQNNHEIFTKDLSLLGRNMNKIVLIDDRYYSFFLNESSGILIPSYNGEPEDDSLEKLEEYLSYCSDLSDLRKRPADPFKQFYSSQD